MPRTNGKPRLVNGDQLEQLRHAWNAAKQAETLCRAAWEYWANLARPVARKYRIPEKKFYIDLKTGEVSRRG